MNVNKIKAMCAKDFARPNLFEVSGFGAADEYCCSAPVPGSSYSTFLWRNTGPGIKLPYEFIVDELQFEFYSDAAGMVEEELNAWHRSVMSEDYKFNFLSDYAKDIIVKQKTKSGGTVSAKKLINAYCTNYQTIQLSSEATNQITKIQIAVNCERIETI